MTTYYETRAQAVKALGDRPIIWDPVEGLWRAVTQWDVDRLALVAQAYMQIHAVYDQRDAA